LKNEKVFAITTRNTLFGFHKKINTLYVDPECTKSVIWCTTNRTIAENMVKRMEEGHRRGMVYHIIDENDIIVPEHAKGLSLFPLQTATFDIGDLEKLCIFHHFDMYVAVSWQTREDFDVLMDCYEFKTDTLISHRKLVEKYMNDMLFKT
jgi:hypothetical protein